jgi:pre-rRNA-processing protein TSR4
MEGGSFKKQKVKAEAMFQRRCGRCPGQVLRYAYGGSPMWCTLPAPDTSRTACPPCAGCGADRVFEMQLMPGLIGLLPNPRDKELSQAAVAAAAALLDDDIDFGVVTVWSCPNSCGRSASEVVIVQAPSDCI